MNNIIKGALIGLASLILVGGLAAGLFWWLFSDGYYTTNPDTWEEVTRSTYSITIPKGMKDNGDITNSNTTFTLLDCYMNRNAAIAVYSTTFTKEQRAISQRLDMYTLVKELMPPQKVDGVEVELQKKDDMMYWEFTQTLDGKTYQVIDACFLSKTGMFEVEVICLADDYAELKEFMFAWLDSFTIY